MTDSFPHDMNDVGDIIRSTPAGELLVDSYERVVGTPEEQGYSELVLYACSDTQARLECYEDGGLDSERMTACLVPISAVYDAYAAIIAAGMDGWAQRRDAVALCGMRYVCKFRAMDGAYTRVSSEQMPEDGAEAFRAVRAAIYRYMQA